MNYRILRYDRTGDPGDALFDGPVIFVFWHEYIPLPVYARPGCNLAMLLSQHQDAEILSHIADFAGLATVRGSSSRGGTAALRELIELGRGMSLAITPDGPRGPRRVLAQGCIYLSSRLQIPIVPIAIGYDRPFRNRSAWDHFAIPRLFSRCRAIVGPRIQIPATNSREELETHRQWVESKLLDLTDLAEDWAEGKLKFDESEQLHPRPPLDSLNALRESAKTEFGIDAEDREQDSSSTQTYMPHPIIQLKSAS